MKTSSQADYLKRIDRVVEIIARSIADEKALPSIATLADYAHLSEYHFMRIYRALAGEPLGATIQRLRLQRSFHLLTTSSGSVTQIAARVGYETPQAFAKAFRSMFNAAPSDVRARPTSYSDQLATLTRPQAVVGLSPVIRVEITELHPFQVAALRNQGDYADLDRAYGALFNWMAAHSALDSMQGIWGVPYHDRRDTPGTECLFDCCLSTLSRLSDDAQVRMIKLGGGQYATFVHIGSYVFLDDAHDVLLRNILFADEVRLRDAPILHRFANDPEVTPEAELETQIYLPIEQQSSP
jgi:AraC family transcriptional regulator